jgi:hypothetical protein
MKNPHWESYQEEGGLLGKDKPPKKPSFCSVHKWSGGFYLCPQHNGSQYKYCKSCGAMCLTKETLKFMNKNNPDRN